MDNDTLIKRFIPPIVETFETVKSKTATELYNIGTEDILMYFIVPIFGMLFMFFLIKYKTVIMDFLYLKLANRGFIWVEIIMPNRHMKTRRIKLDAYRKFSIDNKSYVLDDLDEFIIGYKKSMPFFLYDDKFCLPLKMNDTELTKKVQKALNISDKDLKEKKNFNRIRALELQIDTHILNKVYSKKLISDLYSISSGEVEFKKLVFWVIVGIIGFVMAYYFGWIDMLLSYVT